ncbi:MAG: protein tyrosine phosphatase [Planctomycetota bacterium]
MTPDLLKWADIVLVMEQKHKQRLISQFPGEMRFKKVYVLDIPDDYQFMDAELIKEIIASVDPILAQNAG